MLPDASDKPPLSDGQTAPFWLRLYIVGRAPNSTRAIANLQAISDQFLSGRCRVEIIDVLDDPRRALADGILVTPTLVKLTPLPVQKIVGNLTDHARVCFALGLEE
jgi:circadian clock protein KaiB